MLGLSRKVISKIQSNTVSNAVWVDSVNGYDGYHGLTQQFSVASLARAEELLSSTNKTKLMLARGSHWREGLGLTTVLNGINITSYGNGKLPIIDASDIETSWIKTSGRTNVYESTWTPTQGDRVSPSVFENNNLMTRVASLDICDATPGSFYASNTYSKNISAPLYIHTSNSDNPVSNGSVYEKTVREFTINVDGNCNIRNVRLVRAQSYDGTGKSTQKSVTWENVIFQQCCGHSIVHGGNTFNNCDFFLTDPNITVWASGWAPYMCQGYTSGSGLRSFSVNNCRFIPTINGNFVEQCVAVHAHGILETVFDTIKIKNCIGVGLQAVCGTDNTNDIVIENSFFTNCSTIHLTPTDKGLNSVTVTGTEWIGTNDGVYDLTFASYANTAKMIKYIISDSIFVCSDGFMRTTHGANLEINRCALISRSSTASGGGIKMNMNTLGSAPILNINNVIFDGWWSSNTQVNIQLKILPEIFNCSNNLYAKNGSMTRGRVIITSSDYAYPNQYLSAVQPTNEINSLGEVLPGWLGDVSNREYDLDPNGYAKQIEAGPGPAFVKKPYNFNELITTIQNK